MVMLCESITFEEAKRLPMKWVIEPKHDGIRAYVKNKRLYDRRGKDITEKFPELEVSKLDEDIDGEIVAQSKEFSDVSGRVHLKDRFTIKLASKKNPVLFVCFDFYGASSLPLYERRRKLEELKFASPNFVLTWQRPVFELLTIWGEVLARGEEGLVLKEVDSPYVFSRSASWRKLKAFEETIWPFQGLEEHPRGVTLRSTDGRSVNINGKDAVRAKEIFKKEGCVGAHVQYLPQRTSGAWRFPSFRGFVEEGNGI